MIASTNPFTNPTTPSQRFVKKLTADSTMLFQYWRAASKSSVSIAIIKLTALTTIFAKSQNALIIGTTALYKALSTVVAATIVTNNDVPTTVPTSLRTGNKLLNTSIIV